MFLVRPFYWLWVLLRHDALQALHLLVPANGPLRFLYRLGRALSDKSAWRDKERGGGKAGTRLAFALRKIGPTFIKIGQIIATRADLLGNDIARELSILHDQLLPADPALVRAQIEKAFDTPLEHQFQSFDANPISAASVAQVHFAVTQNDFQVAVKVLRPNIRQAFERDLTPLIFWARIAVVVVPLLQQLKPIKLLQEFRRQVYIEMDLRLEAASMDEVRSLHADDPRMLVPTVDWQRTNTQVLTMSREIGIPIDERQKLLDAGLNVTDVLTQAASLFFKGVFELGVFHGDQHAGNMFIKQDGRVLFVDFGIVGRLNTETRFFLAEMMRDLLERRYYDLAERYAKKGYLPEDANIAQFALSLRALAEPIMGQPLEKVSFANLLGNLLNMGRQFGMSLEPELFLLQKNMLMAEGIARNLDPSINIWTIAQPLIAQWMWKHKGPQAQILNVSQTAQRVTQKLPEMLERADQALKKLEKNQQKTTIERRAIVHIFIAVVCAVALGTFFVNGFNM